MASDSLVLDYYHSPEVKQEIYQSIDEFHEKGGGFCDIGRYSDADVLLAEAVVERDERGCGFMVKKGDADTEIIVSLTGVLVEASLPPYKDSKSLFRTRPGKKDIPVNNVSIAWFDHTGYQASRTGLENIRSQFSLKYGDIDKIPLPVTCGMPVISCENRVVSKVGHIPVGVRDVALDKVLDPKGVIQTNLLNTPRNRLIQDNVLTFANVVDSESSLDIVAANCSPEEFKIGMIVCIQATPTIIPTTKNGNKLILKLRSVLRVNDCIYKKYVFQTRLADIDYLPKPGSGLKRSAAAPQWCGPKCRPLTVEDVGVTEKVVERPEDISRQNGKKFPHFARPSRGKQLHVTSGHARGLLLQIQPTWTILHCCSVAENPDM
ncbi:hypothetical protein PENSPDRAFT_669257 [Peniophora sp. CONT]|nr:hypothetical protein PENSPDRAFT_669257 [Peniophora sp. CONT]